MTERNKYLILFFEANEDEYIMDLKALRLYMNRFIIDEEARFEIIGHDFLQTTTFDDEKPKFDYNDLHPDDYADRWLFEDHDYCLRRPKWRHDAIVKDRVI